MTQAEDLKQAIERVAPELLAVEGVDGIYEGTLEGRPCIRVAVRGEPGDLARRLPRTVSGYPLVLVPSGPVRPQG